MIQKSEKFFIFSWREITVLGLLAIIASGFFFTLGMHYGKKLTPKEMKEMNEAHLDSKPENVPDKTLLEDASRHAQVVTEKALSDATREEVKNAHLKMDVPKAVDLPKKTKAESVGAVGSGRYAIQVGSYPTLHDAQARKLVLEQRGIAAAIRSVRVSGKMRYRVVVLGFETLSGAETQGEAWKTAKKIDAYVVIKAE